MNYVDFLKSKDHKVDPAGFDAGPAHPTLYPFQRDIVKWAVKLGRAAIFADCGLGKSFMQIEWSRQIQAQAGGSILIVAPLAVAAQTIAEAAKLGVTLVRVTEPGSSAPFQITNYDRLHHFTGATYSAIVLDESSILKSLDGATRGLLLKSFTAIPYRLCCTATPAPNDVSELANHAEFLGAMSRPEMLATFFVHDMDEGEWRLKGHAAQEMWRWMARWSVFVRRPSDLGYANEGWALPPLSITDEVVITGLTVDLGGISKRSAVRRQTLEARVARTAEIIASTPGQWLVWCGLNDEETAIAAALGPDCVVINGQTDEDDRIAIELAWREGRVRTLITKPKVFGFGMNWQHCNQTVFLGIGDSYEAYYQSVRRVYRFGQKRPVDVRIVVSDVEGAIAENVKRKEQEANHMAEQIVAAVKDNQASVRTEREDVYKTSMSRGEKWNLFLGDCVERIKLLKNGVVGFSIYSPPFASLYTYSSSRRDPGNCKDFDEFFAHYSFLLPEILRVTMPGRRTAVHCQQLTTSKATHGVIGWRDFRGELIKAHVAAGWIYDGEICIDKNPQAQAIRTKSKQLMFVQKEKDSSWLRPAMADYILLFRAPGENPVPVKTDVSNEEWILFAHPIWYGIRESNVLGYREARENEDEKHICPLQLETIERCIRLWSNPGEAVFSPFAGIGSEGYVARRFGRRFVGIELKESYWKQATKHLQIADAEGLMQPTEAIGKPALKAPVPEAA
jgi:superfamily II DNA or RNA helicase